MSFPPRSIERLRQEAKVISKKEGKPHTEALEIVARTHGYPNWKAVLKAKEDSRALKQPAPPIPKNSVDEDLPHD